MGCAASKDSGEDAPEGSKAPEEPKAAEVPKAPSPAEAKPKEEAPAVKMTDIDVKNVREKRISINFVAQEIDQKSAAASNNLIADDVPTFDIKRIGTSTKHGVMPAPRGGALAKINQDRGIICFPFHGSFDEALMCVFDGHGPKGEKASEFCINTIPELLEKDHDLLLKDPEACLSKNIIDLDNILKKGPLGRIAQSCGTTSNVLWFHGKELYVACSGDSRAIMGSLKDGKIVATDLSDDHKPDLPLEQKRIEKAGGVVAPSGPGGRPARVWADGRVGLAMSRSIGDFECKRFGVIPDPEIKKFTLNPAASSDADGDLFVMLASDGVWEFIESQEAVELVHNTYKGKDATQACAALVQESADRWRRFEGTYRDDITCILARLPFLGEEGERESTHRATGVAPEDDHGFAINKGAGGIERMASGELSPDLKGAKAPDKGEVGGEASENIIRRRLSVANPFEGMSEDSWEVEADKDPARSA